MPDASAHAALLPPDLPPTRAATPTAHSITSSPWLSGPTSVPFVMVEVVILSMPRRLARPTEQGARAPRSANDRGGNPVDSWRDSTRLMGGASIHRAGSDHVGTAAILRRVPSR